MLNEETRTLARHLFYAEHWKIGTIAQELQIHADTVRHALEADRFRGARARTLRATITDPYLPFIRQVLDQYPRLRATRIHQMLVERGYSGSATQLRRVVATLRPSSREPFLRLQTFPGEQGQVDWAHFGEVAVGQARRRLSGFVALLSYSRDMYLEFFFEQVLENFLRGLVPAFSSYVPTITVYLAPVSSALPNRKAASNAPSASCVNPSGQAAASPLWKSSTAGLGSGASKWPIGVAGPAMTGSRWLRPLPKNSLVCCLCPLIPLTPTVFSPCMPIRPSTFALTSMITPFHPKRSAVL